MRFLQSAPRAVVYSSFKQEITGGSLKGTIEPRGEYTVEVEVANWQQFVKILSVELGVIALVCLAGAFVPAKKRGRLSAFPHNVSDTQHLIP